MNETPPESGLIKPGDQVAAYLAMARKHEQAASPGPWRVIWDSCDCGDGYGCSHGNFPHAIATSRPSIDRGPGVPPRDYDFEHSEVPDLGSEDAEFIVAARESLPRLLSAVQAVVALCRDTDGNWLPPQGELPVGEFQAAVTEALTTAPGAPG
jgi:hypothetical protein